jgi:hypothetical protein
MSINVNTKVVENKTKYVNEQGGSKLTYNFVTDPRLKRGHNFGIIYVTSSNYDDSSLKIQNHTKKLKPINSNKFKSKTFYGQIKEKEEQEKNRNEKEGECGICTQKVYTTARPTPITMEEIIQTDPLPPQPQPPLIWPGKTGIDEICQVEDGDLFNFDEEVQPLVHIIVSKVLEESRREVLEEEELIHFKEQQERYKKLTEEKINRIKILEQKEKERFEQNNLKIAQKKEKINLTKIYQKKLKCRMKAKKYISNIKINCINSLIPKKIFKNKEDNYYFTELLPEIREVVKEYSKNDYLIVNKMNDMFKKKKKENDLQKHKESVINEKNRLANNKRIRILIKELEEKRKREEKERRAKRRHDKILEGYRKQIQEELVTNSEWAEENVDNIFDINGYYQKTKSATLIGGPIGQIALVLNYIDNETPEFLSEEKIARLLDVYLEKSHSFVFLWKKEDLEKYKEINGGIDTIDDITRANDEEYKKIMEQFYTNSLVNDDVLQTFFDVCEQMGLTKVKEAYHNIFMNLLYKYKDGSDYGQVKFLEVNPEAGEEIPLLCICLLNQESNPLDNPPPDQYKNRTKKKFSYE